MSQAFTWALPASDLTAARPPSESDAPADANDDGSATGESRIGVERAPDARIGLSSGAAPAAFTDPHPAMQPSPPALRAVLSLAPEPVIGVIEDEPATVEVEAAREDPLHLSDGDVSDGILAAFGATRTALTLVELAVGQAPVLRSVNPAFCRLTGMDGSALIGGDPLPTRYAGSDPLAVTQLVEAISLGRSHSAPLRCRRPEGGEYWAQITVTPIGTAVGNRPRLLVVEHGDVTRSLTAEADTWRARHIDPVTGSAGRSLAEQSLGAHVTAGHPFGLILVQVDGVEDRNDEAGYAAGDAALERAAQRLADTIGGRGRIARHVGTQFMIIASEVGEEGRPFTHRLAEDLESAVRGAGLSAHAGTALFPDDGYDAEDLIDLARAQLIQVRRQRGSAMGRMSWWLHWWLRRNR